jgi:hypothetical protein
MVCCELVRQAAAVLAKARIPVMPLKGALLARWVYTEPGERIGGDVDLLVPEPQFDSAVHALRDGGFAVRRNAFNPNEVYARPAWATVDIDLHWTLFGAGRYSLPTSKVFARGQTDRSLYGAPVILPDPLDAVAHAVGHAAADHTAATAASGRRDAARIAARFGLDPRRAAAHLDDTGLGRAARFTLGLGERDEPFAREVLRCLQPDPLGVLLAGAARALAPRVDPGSLLGRISGLLVCASFAHAFRAAALAARR